MILYDATAQTRTYQLTPPAISYDIRYSTHGRFSSQVDKLVRAIKKNKAVPTFDEECHPLSSAWQQLESLYEVKENWNGNDVTAPNHEAIGRAKSWLSDLFAEVSSTSAQWFLPHVTSNEDGDVVFEWGNQGRYLSAYIEPDDAYFILAWGPSIAGEMIDGSAVTTMDRDNMWSAFLGVDKDGQW